VVRNEENNLINNRNIRFNTISSHRLVPGDIIILNEGDIVPCDCILLRGEALVNEKYSTGDNYLTRKEEVENFTYQKENEKGFVLYLGTEVVKIKNVEYRQRAMRRDQKDGEEGSMVDNS
jgi:cation-transporting ATPase 13A3/4/5